MIRHNLYVGPGNSDFDETLNDYVYKSFMYFYNSVDDNNGNPKRVATHGRVELPAPDPNNFIPSKEVDPTVRKEWVQNIIKETEWVLQQENINKLNNL